MSNHTVLTEGLGTFFVLWILVGACSHPHGIKNRLLESNDYWFCIALGPLYWVGYFMAKYLGPEDAMSQRDATKDLGKGSERNSSVKRV